MADYKVNSANWSQLDFLINNFYEIVEFKRGRGIYGDRVILRRPKEAKNILGIADKFYDFYYMDANAVTELPRTAFEKINIIKKFVVSPESMSIICDYQGEKMQNPINWAVSTDRAFKESKSLDYAVLNSILINRYKLLDGDFMMKIHKHREKQYFLASSEAMNLMPKDYSDKQLIIL